MRFEQVEGALAGFDAADRQDVGAEPLAPGEAVGRREAGGVHAVQDDLGGDAPSGGQLGGHRRRDADVCQWLDQRAFVAGGQLRRGEVVEVVDGPDARPGRVGGDAVLGVHDVVRRRDERPAQQVDRPQDPLPHRLAGHLGAVDDVDGHAHVAEETAVAAAAQRPHLGLLAQRGERLGQGEGVHDAAPGLGRSRSAGRSSSAVGPGRRSPMCRSTRLAWPISAATSTAATASPAFDQVRARMSPPGPTTLAWPRKRIPPIAPVWFEEASTTWFSAARAQSYRSNRRGLAVLGHARGPVGDAGGPGRQAGDDLRAVQGQRAGRLGEGLVVVDQHPDPAEPGCRRRRSGRRARRPRSPRRAGGPCGGGRARRRRSRRRPRCSAGRPRPRSSRRRRPSRRPARRPA